MAVLDVVAAEVPTASVVAAGRVRFESATSVGECARWRDCGLAVLADSE